MTVSCVGTTITYWPRLPDVENAEARMTFYLDLNSPSVARHVKHYREATGATSRHSEKVYQRALIISIVKIRAVLGGTVGGTPFLPYARSAGT